MHPIPASRIAPVEVLMQSHSPTGVSPFLHRPGLDSGPAPEPALHLLAGLWVASCPSCGYQLTTARAQKRCEQRVSLRRCPVCREGA